MRALGFLILGMLVATQSWARVFDINSVSFAPYVMFNGSASGVAATPFQEETSENLSYTSGFGSQLSGEFGFVYARTILSLRLGLEILAPSGKVTASNTSGALYHVSSEIRGFIPKLGLEINLQGNQVSRSFISMSYGAPSVTFKNQYELTAEGQSVFSGVSDHTVETKGSGNYITAGLGYEGLLSDSTTVLCEFGYRSMKVTNGSYTNSGTTFSGPYSSGESWKKQNGAQREIDFSGAFISIGFRIYL